MILEKIKRIVSFFSAHKLKIIWGSLGVFGSVAAQSGVEAIYKLIIPDLDDTKKIIESQESNIRELKDYILRAQQEGKLGPQEMVKINALLESIKEDTVKISSVANSFLSSSKDGACSPFASDGFSLKVGGGLKVDDGYSVGLNSIFNNTAYINYTAGEVNASAYLDPGEGTPSFVYVSSPV